MDADQPVTGPGADADAACARAMQLQIGGQPEAARHAYEAILAAAPGHAATSYCLGMLHLQARRLGEALPLLHAAMRSTPSVGEYWLGYLEALLLLGKTGEARSVLALARRQGLAADAADAFARRLEARAGAGAAGEEDPDEQRLAQLIAQGRSAEARELAIRVIRDRPARGRAWNALGALLGAEGNDRDAVAVLQEAVRLMPDDAEALCNLGLVLAGMERYPEAQRRLEAAAALAPLNAHMQYALALAYSHQALLAQGEAAFRRGLALRPDRLSREDAQNYSNLLFNLAHDPSIDPARLFAEHAAFGEHYEQRLGSLLPPPRNTRSPGRRLKVGFVSGDLNGHPVGQFLEPVATRLAAGDAVELHAYATRPLRDALTDRLRPAFRSWTPVEALGDEALARRIRKDRIDILIDLSGHTSNNRLPVFASRAAPVQASWLGYPGTTGLRNMDYYIADRQWLPPGRFDGQFTEKLVYLPDRWAYRLCAEACDVNPLPALQGGALTFGSFHRLGKLNEATLRLWSGALAAAPGARLLLVSVPQDSIGSLRAAFAGFGVGSERLDFEPRCPMDGYFALHHRVDIALDALGYAGGTTTMHSLAMGVPTLTVAGDRPQAHAGAGILANCGLPQFIAADGAAFVAAARDWSQRPGELASIRAGLRGKLLRSAAGQPALIAEHLERALRRMWQRWCGGLAPESFATDDPTAAGRHDGEAP